VREKLEIHLVDQIGDVLEASLEATPSG